MVYTAFILEDDAQARADLLMHLQAMPDIHVVGHAADIETARTQLPKLKPDLLFSDVMLPPHTSFDLLQSLEQIPFEIIFITSFEEFAIKAFRLAAIDYLIKPVQATELATAVERFRQRKQTHPTDQHVQQMLANLLRPDQTRIALPTLTGFLFVAVKEVVRCESDNTYTTFFMRDKHKIIVSRTLKECEQMLDEHQFFRVHNSHLINLNHVTEYIKGDGGFVKMADGSQVEVSRRRKEEFLQRLK